MKISILLLFPIFGMSQELPPQIATKSSGAECNGLLFNAKITNCSRAKLSCYNLYIDASCDGKLEGENIKIFMSDEKREKSLKIENDLKLSNNKNFIQIAKIMAQQRQFVKKDKNNTDFKLALIKYIVKQLDSSVKTDEQVNAYIIKEKKEGRSFDLKKYVNLEEMGNKTRVKINLSGIIQDEIEDTGPIFLGGLNFTSSGQDNNAQDVFKNNINEAFNCK